MTIVTLELWKLSIIRIPYVIKRNEDEFYNVGYFYGSIAKYESAGPTGLAIRAPIHHASMDSVFTHFDQIVQRSMGYGFSLSRGGGSGVVLPTKPPTAWELYSLSSARFQLPEIHLPIEKSSARATTKVRLLEL